MIPALALAECKNTRKWRRKIQTQIYKQVGFFCFPHHCLLCILICRKMAEFRGDGDMQGEEDAVDAFKMFPKR